MSPVARRYAQALTEEAQKNGALVQVDADVAFLEETLANSRDLRTMLTSPIVPRAKKEAILGRLFESRVSPLTSQFLRLLVEKERDDVIPEILAAYRDLRDERSGIVEATVQTAAPLSPAEAERLQGALEARVRSTIRMRVELEPALIGGLVVRVGDVVYDRSVRHQLQTLRDQLAERAAVRLN